MTFDYREREATLFVGTHCLSRLCPDDRGF
jgi:hypothetical protein